MAFGNATKGYVKAHAGGGGGGTTDYKELLHKPSINGVELLGDKSIGSLSGNIQVKLSDIANINLSNVQNAQTLLYNALSQKWENGNPASGSISLTDITSSVTTGFDVTGKTLLLLVAVYSDNKSKYCATYPIADISDEDIISVQGSGGGVICHNVVARTGNTISLTKLGGDMNLQKAYLI